MLFSLKSETREKRGSKAREAEMEMLRCSLVVTRMRRSGMRTLEGQQGLDVLEVKPGRPC